MWPEDLSWFVLIYHSDPILRYSLLPSRPPPSLPADPPQMDTPQTMAFSILCKYLLSFLLDYCTCSSLCPEYFLHHTHLSSLTSYIEFHFRDSFCQEISPGSPRRVGFSPYILPGHLYLMTPGELFCSRIRIPFSFVCLHQGSWAAPSTGPVRQ